MFFFPNRVSEKGVFYSGGSYGLGYVEWSHFPTEPLPFYVSMESLALSKDVTSISVLNPVSGAWFVAIVEVDPGSRWYMVSHIESSDGTIEPNDEVEVTVCVSQLVVDAFLNPDLRFSHPLWWRGANQDAVWEPRFSRFALYGDYSAALGTIGTWSFDDYLTQFTAMAVDIYVPSGKPAPSSVRITDGFAEWSETGVVSGFSAGAWNTYQFAVPEYSSGGFKDLNAVSVDFANETDSPDGEYKLRNIRFWAE